MEDPVSIATRAAIKRAKRRKSPKVTRDDLLMSLLQAVARFDIVQIGSLAIDLEELGEALGETSQDETDKINKQKVAYSANAVVVFERAAHIARKDNAPKVELIHLLVAFAYEDNRLMAQMKKNTVFPEQNGDPLCRNGNLLHCRKEKQVWRLVQEENPQWNLTKSSFLVLMRLQNS